MAQVVDDRSVADGGTPRPGPARSTATTTTTVAAVRALPFLASGIGSAGLLWLAVHRLQREYRPALDGSPWNSDLQRPDPSAWPALLALVLVGFALALVLALAARHQLRARRAAACALLAGTLALALWTVVDRPDRRCARDTYAETTSCADGAAVARADLIALAPAAIPALALALPGLRARRRRRPA